MECVDDKECIMYGDSHSTNSGLNKNLEGDTFILDFGSNNYTIKDFKDYAEPDKILIQESIAIISPNNEYNIGNEPVLEISKFGGSAKITIDGFTRDEIREWVEIAENPRNHEQTVIDNNPIKIK